MVLHLADDRQGLADLVRAGVLEAEHHLRAAVVGGRLEGDDEAAGEQVLSVLRVVGRVRDEDVRERRGRVGDVGPLVEQPEQVTDGLVDRGGVVVRVALRLALPGLPVSTEA